MIATEPIIQAAAKKYGLPPGTVEDTEDITQDLRLKVFQALQRYDAAKGAWSTYVFKVAENALKTAKLASIRHTAATSGFEFCSAEDHDWEMGDDRAGPEDQAVTHVTGAVAERALWDACADWIDHAISLALMTGAKPAMVCAMTGIDNNTYRARRATLLRRIRKHLPADFEDYNDF